MQNVTALMRVDRPVIVIAKPHPLSMEKVQAEVEPGITVAEIIGRSALNCRVEIGGVLIPEHMWERVRPRAGALVHVTRFPQGGSSGGWKTIFRIFAFAALAVLTYGVGSSAAWLGLTGLGAGTAAAAAAVVGMAGNLLINALIPPASSGVGTSTSSTQLKGITGVQNSADAYGAISCVFGTMVIYPKLAAQSFTELSGDLQYLRCLFDLGYYQNALELDVLRLGTDALTNYTDVEYEVGVSPSLFSQNIHEASAGNEMDTDGSVAIHTSEALADELSIDLVFAAGLFAVDSNGKPITATCTLRIQYMDRANLPAGSSGGITGIPLLDGGFYHQSVDLTVVIAGDGAGATAVAGVELVGHDDADNPIYAATGITITNPGHDYTSATASVTSNVDNPQDAPASLGQVGIDLSGATWENVTTASGLTISNASATVDGENIVVRSSAQQSLRIGLRWKVANSEYNVKVYRVSSDYSGATDSNKSGALTWTVLRTIRYSAPSTTPTTKLAMRIKATDQLNGTVSNFNLKVSQIIPAWNGTAWVAANTSNPAWIYRWILKDCPANPRRVNAARIDDETLKEWGAECEEKGLSFNYTNDQLTTVFELLKIVCACGRASFTVLNGKYSVVRDVAQTVPIQIFTPRNTSNFQGSRTFVDVVHALRVQFINPEAEYQQDEIVVYDDGYDATNATKFEQLQMPGCTDAAMAWRLGRYHLAVGRLRPNSYSWNTDVEHLICNRGDLILFASDVIGVGMGWGRVKSVTMDGSGNVTKLTVDEPQTVTDMTKAYAMRFRGNNGAVKYSLVTFEPDNMVAAFALTTPQPGINVGDLFLFGVNAQDSIPMLINRLEPTTDLAAKITAVDAAPAVLNADAGYIDSTGTYHAGLPLLVSSITGQAWITAPPAPKFIFANSAQNLSVVNDLGATTPTVLVTVSGGGTAQTPINHIDVRWRQMGSAGEWVTSSLMPGEASVTITSVARGKTLQIQARNVGRNQMVSPWTEKVYTVGTTVQRTPITVTAIAGVRNALVATTSLTPLEDLSAANPAMTMTFKGNPALLTMNLDFTAVVAGAGSGAIADIGAGFSTDIWVNSPPSISIAFSGDGTGAAASVSWSMTDYWNGQGRWTPTLNLYGGSGYTHATATVTVSGADSGSGYENGSIEYDCLIDAGTVSPGTSIQVAVLMDGLAVYGPVQVTTNANGKANVSAAQIITPTAGDHEFEVQALNQGSGVTVSAINRSLQIVELR